MVLTHEQIKQITQGALAFESEGNMLHLYRFTDTQRAIYQQAGSGYYHRACCTAGVRFDFYSDTTEFVMEWCFGPRSSRNFMSIDCYMNGVLIDAFLDPSYIDKAASSCIFRFPVGDKRITIFLPYTVELIPTRIEISNGAFIQPITLAKRILMLGDSITQGYDAKYTSQTYAMNVSRFFDWNVLNHGVAGYVHDANTLENIDFSPDIITCAYGTNDWAKAKSMEDFDEAVHTFFDQLRKLYPNTPVLGILPIWRADKDNVHPAGEFDSTCIRLAEIERSYNVSIIDGMLIVPNHRDFYGDYRVHPNDMGFMHYAMGVIQKMQEMF